MNVLLVIAENRAICEALRAILPKSDLLIFEPTLDEAGRRLVSLQADAILLDDGPRLGEEAISAVKAIAPGVPVIALSARGDLVTQAGLIRAGADQVLVKPFGFEELCAALGKLTAAPPPVRIPASSEDSAASRRAILNQHQMALRWISRVSLSGDDLRRFSHSLMESAADIFDAVRCTVLLEGEGGVRVAASQGIPDAIYESLCLQYSSGLMRWFDENACMIDRRALGEAAGQSPAGAGREALKELQVLSGRIAVPLLRNGRVCGALVLGEKASGLDYSPEERELLTLVARTTSAVLERSAPQAVDAAAQNVLSAAFASLGAGVVMIAADRSIAMMNPRAEALLEVRSSDMRGRSVQKLGSGFADVALRCMSSGQPLARQLVHDVALGVDLEINVRPLEQGGVSVVFDRAVESRTATEDIAYSPFWEYLSSRVAQEIKNPMVAINTFAQLLPRKYDSADFRDAFSQVVQKEVQRINGVVETIFEFSRNPRLTLERCDLNETLRSILKSFEDELEKRAIALETKWDTGVDDADIDLVFFTQAVHNVVQNSIEAMPSGGKLTISTSKDSGQAEIRIADTGSGVSPEDTEKIFLPFYSTKERGMGLGLPLANRILKQHRGELRLVANGESGTCFALRIPTASPGPSVAAAPEERDADDSGN
jgi:signal transduction histidine kinase/CheY-like chemotaxis protein